MRSIMEKSAAMMKVFCSSAASFAFSIALTQPLDAKPLILEDYCIQIEQSADANVCLSYVMDHPHGFSYTLERDHACERTAQHGLERTVSIWSDFNADDETAQFNFRQSCEILGSGVPPVVDHRFMLKHTSSRMCAVKVNGKHIIELLVADAGIYKQDPAGPHLPFIYYDAQLTTDYRHRTQDEAAFRRFLSSISLNPKCTAYYKKVDGVRFPL